MPWKYSEVPVCLIEVKNVKKISLTQQLKDAIAGAKEIYGEDAVRHLVVAPHTKVAKTVLGNPNIRVHTMSEGYLAAARQAILGSDILI